MSETFISLRNTALSAARELLSSWDSVAVPIKWPNELDYVAGSERCREGGRPWIKVLPVQATVNNAYKSSRNTGKGYIRFEINEPLGSGTGISEKIAADIGKSLVGENIGNLLFVSANDRSISDEAESSRTDFDVNWEYI